jgi:hypothetical protein
VNEADAQSLEGCNFKQAALKKKSRLYAFTKLFSHKTDVQDTVLLLSSISKCFCFQEENTHFFFLFFYHQILGAIS